jgi:large subunit ribosomal protein L25
VLHLIASNRLTPSPFALAYPTRLTLTRTHASRSLHHCSHIDGKVERVLPRDFQMHPFKPKIICVNWLRYRPGTYPGVKVELPLKSFNDERCPGFKEGGWLLELMPKLPVYASGDEIPDYVMMDLRGKKLGEKIMASELELGEGVTLRTRHQDFAVAKLIGSRRGAEEEEASAEGEGAAKKEGGAAASKPAAAAPGGDKKS